MNDEFTEDVMVALKELVQKGLITKEMIERIDDANVLVLACFARLLKDVYVREGAVDPWEGSPFAWIRSRASRQVGKIGEQLVAELCEARGLAVVASPDSEADLLIGGRRCEIKFSTLWKRGVYTFQQIRDQNYEYVICLGVSPFQANCWVIPKELLKLHVIGHTPQHRGRAGTDTYWLSFPAHNAPAWLASCGGTLAQAFEILKKFVQQ